jgi:hypothetical protein
LSLFGSVPRQVEVEEEAIFYFYFIILKEKEILHFHVFPFVLFCARHVSALEPFFLLWPSRAPLYVSFIQRLIVPFPAPYHFPTPHWIVIPRQSNKLVRRKLSSRLIHTRDTTERPPPWGLSCKSGNEWANFSGKSYADKNTKTMAFVNRVKDVAIRQTHTHIWKRKKERMSI